MPRKGAFPHLSDEELLNRWINTLYENFRNMVSDFEVRGRCGDLRDEMYRRKLDRYKFTFIREAANQEKAK